MSKVKLSKGKHSLIKYLFLGFMVFGIGCISYAMFNIWSQSGYFIDASTSSGYHMPNTAKLPRNDTDKLQSESTHALQASNKNIYPEHPVEGENIGILIIPAINRKLPIIQGTSDKELKKGVGHFIQSVLPGENDNCVISGHRDTALRQINNLKIGDQLIVQTWSGTFTYEVNGTRIVHEDDKTVIVPMDHAVLTLTTCYPFNFIGNASDRFIVSAALVKSK
jgi:sortase A